MNLCIIQVTDNQIRLLFIEVPLFVRLMIETVVSTSMRISELLGLRWRCVDLDRGLVYVQERYYRGDTDEPKSVPVKASTAARLLD